MSGMDKLKNLQVRLRRRPTERVVTEEHYDFVEGPLASLQDGEILLRVIYASVDAGHRAMMDEVAYVVNLNIGDLFPCSGVIGQVIQTRNTDFSEGDFVHVLVATWERYCVVSAQHLYHKIDPSAAPLPAHLAIMGLTGFTAYIGMFDIGRPKKGETVVVSAAAGSVGSVAGQFAKIAGARVVGIAGGDKKCAFVKDKLGFDVCLDYRAGDLEAQLDVACIDGIDVYFENVGGDIQKAVFPRLNDYGRMVLCGQIAQYGDAVPPGPNLFSVTLKRLTIRGYLAWDHFERFPEFLAKTQEWYRSGQLKYHVTVQEGLEKVPEAVNSLTGGSNLGKQIIQVSPDPTQAS